MASRPAIADMAEIGATLTPLQALAGKLAHGGAAHDAYGAVAAAIRACACGHAA
ncbi:MAG: hypothetical protein AB7P07_04805 [Hyphomonadaceae bacterium]